MKFDGSVTTWIGRLGAGEKDAVQAIWDRYFPRLIELARAKLRGIPLRASDEEDVALSAFHAFFQAAKRNNIPQLRNRDDLWRTLVLITAGKAIDQRRRQQSRKRGGGRDDHRALGSAFDSKELEEMAGPEPDPQLAVLIAEEFEALLDRLGDTRLREIALAKLEGYSNEEIAEQLDCSERTVSRRLTVIRRTWEEPSTAGN